jgi:hypothetical protein
MHPFIHATLANSWDRDPKQQESAKYLYEEIYEQFSTYAHENAVLRHPNSSDEERQVIEKSHAEPDERLQFIIDWVKRFDKDQITTMAEQWKSNVAEHDSKHQST